MQNNWPSVLFAMAGGVVLSLGNLSTQYAWPFVGLSVTEVICASITVVIGAFISYDGLFRLILSGEYAIGALHIILFLSQQVQH